MWPMGLLYQSTISKKVRKFSRDVKQKPLNEFLINTSIKDIIYHTQNIELKHYQFLKNGQMRIMNTRNNDKLF